MAGGVLLARTFGGYERLKGVVDSRTAGGGQRGDRTGRTAETAASRSVTVGKPPDELYEMWRDPDRVSSIVGPFADVTASDGDRLRWTIAGPAGREVSWETRFVDEEPGERLRWETPADATVPNEGSIRFSPAPGDRGTVVTLSVDFDPPGGSLGTAVLERFEIVPEALVGTALDRFKSLAETGEVPTLEKNPSGRGRGDLL